MALNDIVWHRMVLLHLWEGNCREFFLLFCSSVFPLHSLCLTSFKVRAAMLSWDNIFFLQRKREIVCKQRFFFKDTWCQASLISKFTIFQELILCQIGKLSLGLIAVALIPIIGLNSPVARFVGVKYFFFIVSCSSTWKGIV